MAPVGPVFVAGQPRDRSDRHADTTLQSRPRLRTALASLASHYASLRHLREPRLALLSVVNLLDKSSSSIIVPLLPLYAESLGVGPIYLGLLFALPTAVSALFSTPFGYLADRVARKPLVVAGMALSAVGVLGLALVVDPRALLALRAVDGFGSAMRNAPTTAYLGDLADDENRGRVMAAYQTLGMLSIAVGPALGGVLVAVGSLATPFLVLGGATLVGATALLRLPPSERADGPDADGAGSSLRDASPSDVRAAATPTVAALVVSSAVAAVGTNALNPLLAPLLAATVDAGPTYVSLAWSSFGVGLVLFVPVGGTLADRAGRRRSLVLGKALWAAVVVGLVVGDHRLLPPLLLALGGVASAFAGPALGALRYESAPEGREASLLGVYGTVGAAGAATGPLLAGLVADEFGLRIAVLGVGLLWTADAVGIAVGVDERPANGSAPERRAAERTN